jgi:hypothetical protein
MSCITTISRKGSINSDRAGNKLYGTASVTTIVTTTAA